MPDYSKGQIYKIWDKGFTKCYIGSTTRTLSRRMSGHKSNYKAYLKSDKCFVSVFDLFDEFGVENCKIVWEEDYPCNNKKELEARECQYQKENECINRVLASRDYKQYYIDKKKDILPKQHIRYKNKKEQIL